MKIVSIVGARPQFIKLAPLSKLIRGSFDEIIIHTGQHFDKEMSEFFFIDLEIPVPDYNLNINSGNHGNQTGRMMIELERIIINDIPDLVIIFGDTNSTLAGALVSSKLHIPLIHIEAGLRSFNKSMPEELNRTVADHVSDFLFAPTENAMRNLNNEGLLAKAFNTGDIMNDSLKFAELHCNTDILSKFNIKSDEYYLLTLHRPYNVDDKGKLVYILKHIDLLNEKIIFPIHPRTMKSLDRSEQFRNIIFIEPLSYFDFVALQKNALKVITDSGGIQKESYILKKPCITIRSETEWVETVEAGWNLLLDNFNEGSIEEIRNFQIPEHHPPIFGEDVALKMFNLVEEFLKGKS